MNKYPNSNKTTKSPNFKKETSKLKFYTNFLNTKNKKLTKSKRKVNDKIQQIMMNFPPKIHLLNVTSFFF